MDGWMDAWMNGLSLPGRVFIVGVLRPKRDIDVVTPVIAQAKALNYAIWVTTPHTH